MLDEKLINSVKQYREFNFNDEMNLINIFQTLSHDFPKSLPLSETDIVAKIHQNLTRLGFDSSNLFQSKDNIDVDYKQNGYKWPKYHFQLYFRNIKAQDQPFSSVTYDKKNIMLVIDTNYASEKLADLKNKTDKTIQEELNVSLANKFKLGSFYIFMPIDDELLNSLILLRLCEQQSHILNDALLKYAARLIYVQQSSISVKVKNATQLKTIEHDFGKVTNNFLHDFRVPETDSRENTPQIRITDLIKYMYDVVNDKPVDSELFNLITQGQMDTNSINIIINQARQLALDNVLTEASTKEKSRIKHDLSKPVANRVLHIWKINHQKDNNEYSPTAKHILAVHGTQNLSVLNILGEGLLDSDSLAKQGSTHYHYTGSGLGKGIYFARMDQAEKSYNYTETNDKAHSYMFLADIAYTKVVHTKHYGSVNDRNHKIDLVWGDFVGSYDRDEIVAKNPKQVQIKYLLELE